MIKVGLIGCGFMGGMHSACYKVLENARVVAVADVRKDKAEEKRVEKEKCPMRRKRKSELP